jgi:hypothetical protein
VGGPGPLVLGAGVFGRVLLVAGGPPTLGTGVLAATLLGTTVPAAYKIVVQPRGRSRLDHIRPT